MVVVVRDMLCCKQVHFGRENTEEILLSRRKMTGIDE
jgi:hypothetical protein